MNRTLSLLRTLFVSPVKLYQYLISPLFPSSCRFTPTCSHYFIEAVMKYGCVKGSLLGIKRLLKCHPLHKGGYDPLQ